MAPVTLDPEYLLAAIGNPSAFTAEALRSLCLMFSQEMQGRVDQLRQAAESERGLPAPEDVDFYLHSIRGSAAHFGALRMVEMTLDVDTDATYLQLITLAADLDAELGRVRMAMNALVESTLAQVA